MIQNRYCYHHDKNDNTTLHPAPPNYLIPHHNRCGNNERNNRHTQEDARYHFQAHIHNIHHHINHLQ